MGARQPPEPDNQDSGNGRLAAGYRRRACRRHLGQRHLDLLRGALRPGHRCVQKGIKRAAEAGHDVSKIHSVASFFVSRLDTEVDKRLETIGTPEALAARGKAGVANAQRAYALFEEELLNSDDLPEGANVQRPLWASTGVKNPEYPATLYVSELAGPHTVNTMPEKTIDAVLSDGNLHGDTSPAQRLKQMRYSLSSRVWASTSRTCSQCWKEGVDKFVAAWMSCSSPWLLAFN